MRISDWSSDVCSSDLPAGVEGLHVLAADRLHRRLRGQLAVGTVGAEQQRRQDALGRARRILLRGSDPRHRLALEAVEVRRCRSEEHTSELQSLMRISYAVFCLKKKKTYTTPQPNRTNKLISSKKHTA